MCSVCVLRVSHSRGAGRELVLLEEDRVQASLAQVVQHGGAQGSAADNHDVRGGRQGGEGATRKSTAQAGHPAEREHLAKFSTRLD